MPNLTVCHHLRILSLSLLIFLGLAILNSVLSQPIFAAGNKCGVNVGPYYGQVNQVRALAKAGGWIVALGTLGDCAGYGSLFGNNLDVVIRAYNAGQPFDEAQAIAWTATLGQLDSKDQMIYFMPWNEPNQGGDEGGSTTDGTAVVAYMNALRKHLGDAGLLGTKVTLLSPMLNKTHRDFSTYLGSVGGADAFYKLASGSSINEYDNKGEGDSTYVDACRHSNPFNNNCKYDQIDIPSPYYALESGVTGIYAYPRYEDAHISKMLSGSWSQEWSGDDNFKMFAVFSYDPLPSKGEPIPQWDIFQATETRNFYSNNCTPGTVTPLDGFDEEKQTQFETWRNAQMSSSVLVECGECGYAPKDEPGLCSGVGRDNPTFDLSIYDDYDADPNAFYVQFIKGLEKEYDERDVTEIRNDMITQGYEAHCATPQFKIKLNQYGEPAMHNYLRPINSPFNTPEIGEEGTGFGGVIIYGNSRWINGEDPPYRSTLTVDYRNVLLPVFRDVTGKRWLTTSLEEYFGFGDLKVGNPPTVEINSAPVNSLLARSQRCIHALDILVKQEEMCNKIKDPEGNAPDYNCALYSRPIPESDFTVLTLLKKYRDEEFGQYQQDYPDLNLPEYFDPRPYTYNQREGIQAFCRGRSSQDKKDLHDGFEEFFTAVINTPLNIDRAYRLGFLVTVIEMIYPTPNNMFSLFEHPNAGFIVGGPRDPQDAILINAFKIPDLGTNKGDVERLNEPNDQTAGNVYWTDTTWLTRNSLFTTPLQEEYEELIRNKRTEVINASVQYDLGSSKDDEIHCLVGGKKGIGAPECNDPLSKANIDIVNTYAKLSKEAEGSSERALELQEMGFDKFEPECPELRKETATQILDPGTLQPLTHPSKIYTQEFGADLLNKLFKDSTHETGPAGSPRDPSFAETWREGDPTNEVENPWPGGLRDWGLKSIFHVVRMTQANNFPNTCCHARKVRHFLVYPMGYDLDTVQTVLAGSFFTTDELISLAEAAEEYDRIQVSGDVISFEGGKKDKRFYDVYTEPNGCPAKCWIEGDRIFVDPYPFCQPIYYVCEPEFGWEVVKDGETLSAGILGGRLGFYLREVQKVLNTKASDARQYLDTCETTEQFLRGQCGGEGGLVPTPTPDTCTDLSCLPPAGPPGTLPPAQPGPTCNDPTQDAMVIDSFMTDSREWKFAITCPTCTGGWGDIAIVATGPGINCNWAGGFLPVQGRLEYPTSAAPTMCYGSKVPDSFHGNFCINLTITSNPAGNQCQGTIHTSTCFEVP